MVLLAAMQSMVNYLERRRQLEVDMVLLQFLHWYFHSHSHSHSYPKSLMCFFFFLLSEVVGTAATAVFVHHPTNVFEHANCAVGLLATLVSAHRQHWHPLLHRRVDFSTMWKVKMLCLDGGGSWRRNKNNNVHGASKTDVHSQ